MLSYVLQVRLLEHESPTVVTPALRIIGNLVTGDDHQVRVPTLARPHAIVSGNE